MIMDNYEKALERIAELEEAIKEMDRQAEAGMCCFGLGNKHLFLRDIRRIAKEVGIQGGLTDAD